MTTSIYRKRCPHLDKLTFDTPEAAESAACNIARKYGAKKNTVYQCEFCQKWHMTSKPGFKRPEDWVAKQRPPLRRIGTPVLTWDQARLILEEMGDT